MCLFKIHEEDDRHHVPARVVVRTTRTRSPSPVRRRSHHSVQRVSREYIREQRPSSSYIAVPAPRPLAIPAPQPVPVFVDPPAPPPVAPSVSHHHHSHHGHHYVEVSPRSSVSSHSPSRATESVVYEREYRREGRRDYSPERSPQYDTFRYVEGAPPSESDRYERYVRRERSRSRARSRSRDYGYDDPRGSYRETTTRVVIDEDGRRRREYTR